jgi:hypothetical protein
MGYSLLTHENVGPMTREDVEAVEVCWHRCTQLTVYMQPLSNSGQEVDVYAAA